MSTAIISAATVPARLDSRKLMNAVAVMGAPAPPNTRSRSSRNPSTAMQGSTTHRTSITLERANPISSSRTSRRVGLVATAGPQDVAREQLVELGFHEPDLAQPAAGRERALDGGVHGRVGLYPRGQRDPPLAGLALDRRA